MFDKFLFATDLSPASDAVAGCVGELRSLGARSVFLVHCLGIRHLEEMKHLLLPAAEARIAEQKSALERQGFRVEAHITPGLPQLDINRLAIEKNCSLIVAGTIGRTMTDEIRLGGVISAVIHRATRPVLLVRLNLSVARDKEKCALACKSLLDHVLFPTDFSDNAEHAFRYVRKLARSGVKQVTLAHVQDKVRIGRHLKAQLPVFNEIDRARLERMKAQLQREGPVKVALSLTYGSPTEQILKQSRQGGVSLIVMGSQGRGFITEIFLGSVSHSVARNAPVSVLLVPAVR